jgi:hypothetical protein
MQVGEIATAATGDQDLFADAIGAFEQQDTASAFAGFDGTHQAGGPGSENDDVTGLVHAEFWTGDRATGFTEMSLAKGAAGCPVLICWVNLLRALLAYRHQDTRFAQDL